MKPVVVGIVVVLAVGIVGYMFWLNGQSILPSAPTVTNFDECSMHYSVMESYPRQCNTPDGQHFVEDIGNELDKTDLIRIESPRPGAMVMSPLQVNGEARGTWFFEADFPVRLLDADGNEIGLGIATAEGDWMTEDFVPFLANITFETPSTPTGTLILEKSNASGLPEHADALIVPVRF